MNNNVLALFDFDGTITTKDTLIEFLRFAVGKRKFFFGLIILSPILILFKLKLLKNYYAKERVISFFFKGMSLCKFKNLANDYSLTKIDKIVRAKAKSKIKWHKDRKHKIIIISASIEDWIFKWCIKNEIELIATKLEEKNGFLTGRFLTKNCYGIEKVKRLKLKYNIKDYKYIYVYGDSDGDKEMLDIATHKHYRYFN